MKLSYAQTVSLRKRVAIAQGHLAQLRTRLHSDGTDPKLTELYSQLCRASEQIDRTATWLAKIDAGRIS